MGTDIQKWADTAMFRSESHNASEGPKVHLLAMPADPLGQIAACAKMYKGEVVRSLSDVTHAERKYYMAEMQKTKLKMPLESVTFHFMIENVTRAFTHQLVRQRTAAYAQESMRFAVVEDMNQAVALPPSLAAFNSIDDDGRTRGDYVWSDYNFRGEDGMPRDEQSKASWRDHASDTERQYVAWRETVATISRNYMDLVNSGMPAEDARGLMPTNIITRVNYITNLRALLDHAGNRLCTQAQFEWRLVFAQIAKAIREYGWEPCNEDEPEDCGLFMTRDHSKRNGVWGHRPSEPWQYEAISELFRPVCYMTGKCEFRANFDRKCSIRDRVDIRAANGGTDSTQWHKPFLYNDENGNPATSEGIRTAEWLLDPNAAR